MTVKVLLIVSALIFPAVGANAEDWMKQSSPDSLGLFAEATSRCPFSTEELEELAKGEFLRAGLKPTKSLDLNLIVFAHCLPVTVDDVPKGWSMSFSIRFGTQTSRGHNVSYEVPRFGAVVLRGQAGRWDLLNDIQEGIDRALTAYLEANSQE